MIQHTQSNAMEVAQESARAAGAILRSYYDNEYFINKKENLTPVTEADIASEQAILERLKDFFPYSIVSEEAGASGDPGSSDYVWFVDPLDGTKGFINKTGDFSVIIGLAYHQEPVMGVIYLPLTDELYFAQKGNGAYYQKGLETPQQAQVSDVADFREMKIVMSKMHTQESDLQAVTRIGATTTIRIGSVGIKIGLVARGEYEVFINTSNKAAEWDTCGPHIILQEAGGIITDLYGASLRYCQSNVMRERGILASNGVAHAEIVQQIQAESLTRLS